MRVALVSMETVHHRDTEGGRRFQRLAEHLAAAGHDVTVFCAQWWNGFEETMEEAGVTYRAVTIAPSVTSFALRLPVVLARHKPDVVHATPDPPVQVVAASVGGSLARAPLAVEWYGDESLPESVLAGRAARSPDAVVTPSELVRTAVRERGAAAGATRVIPESIDMSLVRETPPADPTDVVYAQPLDESANVDSLFLALAELRDREWAATIVGDGPVREEYERQAADLRIDDRVRFAGECSREERVAIYRGAHVFVQTAYRASFATELLWALASGCIGIVEYQARSSAHELIEGRERSFRVTSPQQLADAIVESADLERREVEEDFAAFDHDAVLEEYLALYEELREDYGLF